MKEVSDTEKRWFWVDCDINITNRTFSKPSKMSSFVLDHYEKTWFPNINFDQWPYMKSKALASKILCNNITQYRWRNSLSNLWVGGLNKTPYFRTKFSMQDPIIPCLRCKDDISALWCPLDRLAVWVSHAGEGWKVSCLCLIPDLPGPSVYCCLFIRITNVFQLWHRVNYSSGNSNPLNI